MVSPQTATHPKARPLIPERYLDVPAQRLYYLSVAALCQVFVVVDCNRVVADTSVKGNQNLRTTVASQLA
jgi:hypothetical protein